MNRKIIFIASDHAGFNLKSEIIKFLSGRQLVIQDLGPKIIKQDDDFPEYAFILAKKVIKQKQALGILICRSGIGMSVAANKVKGIRAGLCTSVGQAITARAHINCNVLVLSADFIPLEKTLEIVKTFFEGEYSEEERYQKRLKKIDDYERG